MRVPTLILACAAAAATASGAAAASGGARVVGDCVHSQVRPSMVVLFCADANAALTHLRWSKFGGATARATGDYAFNDCKPYCAAGKVHSYPVTAVFSRPRRCPDGRRDYRVLVAAYASATNRPSGTDGGRGTPGSFTLNCPIKG